jgi:hypothetical protein
VYRPTVLYACLLISGLAALIVAALALKRHPQAPSSSFTPQRI